MECSHLIAGARESERLVRDDADRVELLRRLAAAVGAGAVLAYCVLDTHCHVVVDGRADRVREAGGRAVFGYTKWFNARHERSGALLRGPVTVIAARSSREVARQIDYVHENPLKTRTPLVTDETFFEWSSARAFAGLSRGKLPNVPRALAVLGKDRRRVVRPGPPLEDLARAAFPSVGAGLVLAAAAQVFGVTSGELVGGGLAPEAVAARAVYVTLGRLEGFRDGHLAAPLGRTRRRVSQIGSGPVHLVGVRIARTLIRVPGLRARLGAVISEPHHASRS
jgi:hypothetical protein